MANSSLGQRPWWGFFCNIPCVLPDTYICKESWPHIVNYYDSFLFILITPVYRSAVSYVCIYFLIPLAFIISLFHCHGIQVALCLRVSICVLEFSSEDAAAELPTAACNLPFKTLAPEEWRVANVTLSFSADCGELEVCKPRACAVQIQRCNWVRTKGHLD